MLLRPIFAATIDALLATPIYSPLRVEHSTVSPRCKRGKGHGHKQHARAQAKINARRRRRR